MLNTNLPPMRLEVIVCPFCECRNRIGIHSHQQRRYICHVCDQTFAETVGTSLYGLKYPAWIVTLVLTLLASGGPPLVIVFAFEITEIIQHVRAAARLPQPILFAVDGLRAYVTATLKIFRDPIEAIMQATQVELGVINTAYIE